jgi:IclR family transcriptional regulator, KDG regulon repressor
MIHSVANASTVFKLFSEDIPEWGVSEAAKRLGLAKSTTSELMSTLASQGLLTRTSTGRYRLGWYLIELSRTLLNTSDFYTEANPVMRGLVSRFGESTSLGVLSGSHVTFVERLFASSGMQNRITRFNGPLPAYGSSIGKVLIAGQAWPKVIDLLKEQDFVPFTPNTITDLETLASELEHVRKRGYAYDHEEVALGLCCVAAPIRDIEGHVIAAISLSIPAYRYYPLEDDYTSMILKTASRISVKSSSESKKHYHP